MLTARSPKKIRGLKKFQELRSYGQNNPNQVTRSAKANLFQAGFEIHRSQAAVAAPFRTWPSLCSSQVRRHRRQSRSGRGFRSTGPWRRGSVTATPVVYVKNKIGAESHASIS